MTNTWSVWHGRQRLGREVTDPRVDVTSNAHPPAPAAGVLMAALAAFLTHAVVVTAPLFAQPQDVPSVTPKTRFHIGTAASAVPAAAVAPLGLTNTGADSAAEWSPEHIGEPQEDFPLFTILRHVVFRPIGLAPAQPLPGDRATF